MMRVLAERSVKPNAPSIKIQSIVDERKQYCVNNSKGVTHHGLQAKQLNYSCSAPWLKFLCM